MGARGTSRGRAPYGRCQRGRTRGRKVASREGQLSLPVPSQESATADVAFVVTLAVFALMILAVKGATRL
jgi:hypothetical protein